MMVLPERASARNPSDIPRDLFDAARERAQWASPPTARIALRFRLPIATAAVVAYAAGLDRHGATR
jgi:hypothetical protein